MSGAWVEAGVVGVIASGVVTAIAKWSFITKSDCEKKHKQLGSIVTREHLTEVRRGDTAEIKLYFRKELEDFEVRLLHVLKSHSKSNGNGSAR